MKKKIVKRPHKQSTPAEAAGSNRSLRLSKPSPKTAACASVDVDAVCKRVKARINQMWRSAVAGTGSPADSATAQPSRGEAVFAVRRIIGAYQEARQKIMGTVGNLGFGLEVTLGNCDVSEAANPFASLVEIPVRLWDDWFFVEREKEFRTMRVGLLAATRINKEAQPPAFELQQRLAKSNLEPNFRDSMALLNELVAFFRFFLPETPVRPKPVSLRDQRDGWIYEEMLKGTPLKKIMFNLGKRREWDRITSPQGIHSASNRYATRHGLEPPPERKRGRPKSG